MSEAILQYLFQNLRKHLASYFNVEFHVQSQYLTKGHSLVNQFIITVQLENICTLTSSKF